MTVNDVTPERIETLAKMLARKHFLRECPGRPEAAGFRWAARHWSKFRDAAIEAFALMVLTGEKRPQGASVPPAAGG